MGKQKAAEQQADDEHEELDIKDEGGEEEEGGEEQDEDRGDALEEETEEGGEEEETDEGSEEGTEEGGEEEETDEGGEEEGPEEEDDPDSKVVPRSRLNRALGKNQDLKVQNALLLDRLERMVEKQGRDEPEEEEDKPPEFDFDAAEEKYMEAVSEGDTAKAKQIRKEIRAADRAHMEYDINRKTSAGAQQSTEVVKVQTMVREYETLYPALKKGSRFYNPNAVSDILDLQQSFIASQRYTPSQAFDKAVKITVKTHGVKTAEELGAKTKVKKSEKIDVDKGKAEDRKKGAVKKAVDTEGKQPPKMKGGKASKERSYDEVDISTMTDEEFNALPESVKKKLRGD